MLRTNRSGAYSCSTIVDCNTRKYHGLLVVPVPELDDENHVLLSSLDVTVIQHGAEFNLGLHKYQGNNYSPMGHKYIREFDCDKVPTTLYRVGGVILKKEVVFQHYENRILIRYTLVDGHSATTLRFRPFLAFRSVRQFTHENATASRDYAEVDHGIKTCMYAGYPDLYIQFSKKNEFKFCPDWYRGVEYPKEQERGYASNEDLYVPGYFEMGIKKGETIVFSAATSEIKTSSLKKLFDKDFDERSEYIDWLGFLMSGAGQTKEENDKSSQTSSFTWNATGSYTVPLPDAVKPFINSLSLSGINSSVAFSSKTRNSSDDPEFYSRENKNYSPERSFYYPSQVTPFKISSKISGTIIQYPPSVKKAKSAEKIKFDIPLVAPEIISVPQNKSSKKESDASSTEGGSAENTERTAALAEQADGKEEKASEETVLSEKDLPLLEPSQKHSLVTLGGLKYTLGYSINPQYTSQLSYNSSDLKKPGDFSWSNLYSSYYQVKVPSTLTSSFSYGGSFASMTNTLSFNPVYQEHPNLDGYTESSASSVRKTDYNARKLDLTGTNSVSFNPFAYSTVFKNTGLNWNTTVKVLRTEFLGDETNPEWDYITSDLTDSDSVTAHTLSATLSAVEDKFSQVLTLSTTLPPQVDEYDASLKLTFPFLSLSFSSGVEQKSKDDETFVLKPFKQSASLKLFDSTLSLTESFNYELEDDYADALKIALSWNNLQLAYTMQYTNGYEPKKDDQGKLTDWEMKTDKEFIPYSASLAYSTKSKTYRYWKNRITWAPSLSTSIVYDCLRPTNSYFRFAPSISFKINEFFELSFTSESRNSVIFRYFQDYIGYEDTIGGEKNPFVDLWNSFVFWSDDAFFDPDQTVRKSSGFKIKNLKISITHKLCDWDMSASLTFKPRAVTGDDNKKSYDYHPYFTFGVTWRPMASMKTQIVDEYGEWKLNP